MNQDAIRKAYRAGYHVDDDGQILTAAGTTLRPSTDRRGYLFVRILLDGKLLEGSVRGRLDTLREHLDRKTL